MPSSSLRRRQIAIVALLFVGYASLYFCRADLSVATPLLIEELRSHGLTQADALWWVGTITSVGTFGYALGKLFLGGLGDYWGGRISFLIGLIYGRSDSGSRKKVLERLFGQRAPALEGCVDIDISGTPLTNSLPIRRVPFVTGAAQRFDMAFVPLDTLEPFRGAQIYTRLEATRFRYAAADGSFEQVLTVDDAGFVVDYPTLFARA